MKYRKKPVVVEAYQTDKEIFIHTLEGDMKANVGDYIITGVNGKHYPCKPDIFEKTYELVDKTMPNELTDSEIVSTLQKNIRDSERINSSYALLNLNLVKETFDLINRLQAENERLLQKLQQVQAENKNIKTEENNMSSSEVARNQLTFEERAKYFEKDVKEFFDSYKNESGGEDCIEVCLIQAGRRVVAMAEKEINRQKEEIESLKAECQAADGYEAFLKLEAHKEILERLRFEIVNKPSEIKIAEASVDLLNGMTRRHHEILDIIDNLLKELLGDDNAE